MVRAAATVLFGASWLDAASVGAPLLVVALKIPFSVTILPACGHGCVPGYCLHCQEENKCLRASFCFMGKIGDLIRPTYHVV